MWGMNFGRIGIHTVDFLIQVSRVELTKSHYQFSIDHLKQFIIFFIG